MFRKTNPQLRYTNSYRPVEMHLFQKAEEKNLHTLTGGYSYTFKEDVYALGITILTFLKQMKVSYNHIKLFEKLYTLINDIIAPMTIEMIYPYLNLNKLVDRDVYYEIDFFSSDTFYNYVQAFEIVNEYLKAHFNNLIEKCNLIDYDDIRGNFYLSFVYAVKVIRCYYQNQNKDVGKKNFIELGRLINAMIKMLTTTNLAEII